MPKVYCAVLPPDGHVIGAIVDLDSLPAGVHSNLIAQPYEQAQEIVDWFGLDIDRAARIVSNISNNKSDEETRFFLTQLASVWENLPPADAEKDLIITVSAGKAANFFRTSPEVAKSTFLQLKAITG